MNLNYNRLIVKQKVELLEVFTGIESKNKYKILSDSNEEVLFAYEESNWFARIILKRMRPLKIYFKDNQKNIFLRIEKGFAFLFPEFKVYDSNNMLIAKIKTKFGLGHMKIKIFDNNNHHENLIYYAENKLMHPWTFNIYKNETQKEHILALILKNWMGIGKEFFTDSDNFLIDFKNISNEEDKKKILALSIIVDLYVFEH